MTLILRNADIHGLKQGLFQKKKIYNNLNPSKSALLASVLSAFQVSKRTTP